jgi:ribosome-binding factor A
VIAALDRHKKYLRTEIAHRINLKFAPEIRFKVDDSFDNVAKIDALLNSDKVKQDLQPRKEPAEK